MGLWMTIQVLLLQNFMEEWRRKSHQEQKKKKKNSTIKEDILTD